jgi:ParB family chromosome partitioning protein
MSLGEIKSEAYEQKITKDDDEKTFKDIPVELIDTPDYQRTDLEMDEDFINSTESPGILHPVLLIPRGERFEIIAGMRRYEGCKRNGSFTVPARILSPDLSWDELLRIALIENSQRKDMKRIEMAKICFDFISAREDIDNLEEILRCIIKYDRRRKTCSESFIETVSTLTKATSRTSKSIYNMLRLLTLPARIQEEIKKGRFKDTHGFLFAEYINHPDFEKIFQDYLCQTDPKSISKKKLKDRFEGAQFVKKNFWKKLKDLRTRIEADLHEIEEFEAEQILGELEELRKVVEQRKSI